MAVAKGLAGGYVPLGVTIYHDRVAAVLEAEAGGPMTGHTFTGHTLACAAGVAVQRIVARDRLLQRVAADVTGTPARVCGAPYGSDLRLFTNLFGIPGVLFGPGDIRLAHFTDEHVSLAEVECAALVLATTICEFCGVR